MLTPPPRHSAVPGAQTVLAGRYQMLQLIGRGGMAEVWAARDQVLQRDVAVKLLSSRFRDDEQFQQRFRREAQQAASLNHPNIVAVYDTGQHEGLPFIVMELVRGRSLQQVLAEGGLTEERALEVCADTCSALAYAHEHGIVHRDVKPGNILIADDGTVKVTDFGIARAINSETVTQTAAILGTAAYLSPEQAQGAAVDARSDIYSLGIVLYELLTNRPPFIGDSAVGLAYQHVQEDPVPPRQLAPTISPAAEAIAMKAMAKNPSNRYPTGHAMRDDLLRAHAGQPVSAPVVLLPVETAVLDSELLTARRKPQRTPDQERRRHVVGYALLGVFALLAMVGVVLLVARLMGGGVTAKIVPDVRNQTYDEARRTLEEKGLRASYGGEENSNDVPPGKVARQDPEAFRQAAQGDAVTLFLSKGPQQVKVPRVTGLSELEAQAQLRTAGLKVGEKKSVNSDDVPRGQAMGTEPPADTTVDWGTSVTLVVSLGQAQEIVPPVASLLESEARFRLEERGFTVVVNREFSDSNERGRVIRQDPAPNVKVKKGSPVTIVVSDGRRPAPTPSPSPTPTTSPTTTSTPSPKSTGTPTAGAEGSTEQPTGAPTPVVQIGAEDRRPPVA